MKKTIPLVLFIFIFSFCSQEKKLLRHAANSVERSNFDQALADYDKILQKNESSFFGNAGKGIVLSEFMGRHEQAIPFLEKALKNTPDKTKPILNSNLGKSYHFMGNYDRALTYYTKSQKDNDPKWADYDAFLTKRIADCHYAIEHPKVALPENQSITNVGTTINTDLPEYTPVVANGKMYFTSKRKDTPKEKKNGVDGKFFEAIYVAKINTDGTFGTPERYTLPNSKKSGEAVMSITPDGQKMYVFRGGKILESDLNSADHKVEALDDNINFTSLQNHASLSQDGKTIYFTSDSENGRGGTDIYFATKKDDGSWSDPQILDYAINTEYDEEAPFMSSNGTLFFSSNGHPGYGGFDVYKTTMVNGTWSKPENLGQPINSPGDDMYFTLRPNSSKGYYASARPGGHGDLDIYKIHYISTETTPCQPDDQLTIVTTADPNNQMMQTVEVNVPESYKSNIRSYRWDINGQPLAETSSKFQYTFTKADTYKIGAQLVVFCDSCPTLIAKCAQKQLSIEAPQILTKAEPTTTDANTSGKKGKKPSKKDKKANTADLAATPTNTDQSAAAPPDNTATAQSETAEESAAMAATSKSKNTKTGKNKSGNTGTDNSGIAENNTASSNTENSNNKGGTTESTLSDNELADMNWNTSPSIFDYNTYNLNSDSKTILDQNIQILKDKTNLMLVINGYADSRGTAEYNKSLSLKRANAVKQYFVSNGISDKRIKSVKGLGETELTNNCSDGVECSEEQHADNRRVKINVVAGKKNSSSITNN